MRIKTEDLRDQRTIVYAKGDTNLADFWTRIWPDDPIGTDGQDVILHLAYEHGDYEATQDEIEDLKARHDRYGLKWKQLDTHIEVQTGNRTRVFIPQRSRVALLYDKHTRDHAGAVKMSERLQEYYWPTKRTDVQAFLRSCACQTKKPTIVPRGESKQSKEASTIDAERYLDLVLADIYMWDGIKYLTFYDVATGRNWCKRLMATGEASGHPGAFKRKIEDVYREWESSLERVPTAIRVDNEAALRGIPHNRLIINPSWRPQMMSKIERYHKELGKQARISGATPDDIYIFTQPETSGLEGGEALAICMAPDCDRPAMKGLDRDGFPHRVCCKDHLRKARMHFRQQIPYDGRELMVGQLVRQRIHERIRAKHEDPWSTPCRIVRRIGKKVYEIVTDKRRGRNPQRHIDDLKEYDVGDRLLRMCTLTAEAKNAARHHIGDIADVDTEYANGDTRFNDDWKDKTINVNYVGLNNMEQLVTKLKEDDYDHVYAIIPDLPCMEWLKELNELESKWYAIDPEDDETVWQDMQGQKLKNQGISWWIVRFDSID
ncbi:hypothetical protein AAMO2058_001628900 [Amorphochlora amoebiformis]